MTAWARILAAAQPAHRQFEAALGDQRGAQERLLKQIVGANRDTAFGRDHGFADIRTIDEFRRAVPVRAPSDYDHWISRIAEGESAVLTQAPVIAFEQTSGTGSGSKLIPYTEAGLAAFRDAVLPWLADLARRRPGATAGRVYASISPATRTLRQVPAGIPVGLESDAAYLGADVAPDFAALLAVSPLLGQLGDVDEWRLETLAQLIAAEDLSFVSIWSPTFLTGLLDAIPQQLDRIVARLQPGAANRLRAARRSSALDTAMLWPMLDCISCWTDGASAPFARDLARRFPHAAIDAKGLLATEAAMTTAWGNEDGAVTALRSCLVEYVDDQGQPRLCDALTAGERYHIVITTPGGLYRYAIGDIVRCTSVVGGVARLRFEGRAGLTSDLVGEKLDDAFVSRILAAIDAPAALVPASVPHPHYQLWIDAIAQPPAHALDAMARAIDAALGANTHYAYARKLNQLAPITALHRPGFVVRRLDTQAAEGTRIGDLKAIGLLHDMTPTMEA